MTNNTHKWLVKSTLFLIFGIYSLSERALGPISPIIRSTLNLSEAQIGLVNGATMAGSLFTVIPLGILVDRTAPKLTLVIMMISLGLAAIGVGLQKFYLGLVLALLFVGFVRSSVIPVINKVAALNYSKKELGSTMGIINSGAPLAGLIGALSFPAIAAFFNWNIVYLILGVLFISTAIIAWYMLPKSKNILDNGKEKTKLTQYFQKKFIIVITTYSLLSGCMYAARAFLTLFLVDVYHLSPIIAGVYFAITEVVAILGRIIWGFISDKYLENRSRLLAINAWITMIAFFILSVIHVDIPLILLGVTMVVLGFGVQSSWGMQSVLIVDLTGSGRTGGAVALQLFFLGIGGTLGPVFFGQILQFTQSYRIAMGYLAVTAALSAIIYSFLSIRRFSKSLVDY